MSTSFDQKYFKSYAVSLLELDSIDEIIESLPSKSQEGYEEFITDLINFINNEIKSNKDLKEETTYEADLLLISKELEKLELVRAYLVSELANDIGSNDISKTNKELIFLTTNAGNPCIEKDLKGIPREYADSLIELFERLENFGINNSKFDDVSCKKFVTSSDVFEMKNFKIRLYFSPLDKDTVLVIMATLKNQDNPKIIKESLNKRLSMLNGNSLDITTKDFIKKEILDDEKKQILIEEHRLIKESILETLKEKTK